MKSIFLKMLDLLSAQEKRHLGYIFATLLTMAFIEMAGIASIMPFMAVVANPKVIETNKWLKSAYELGGFTDEQNFLFSLGLLLLIMMVLSNLFKALGSWMTLRFDNRLNYALARRLLAQYLARPYAFFLNRNTAEMGKNVLMEVRNVIAGVLSAGMQVISNSLVFLFILGMLLVVDPVIAMAVPLILGGTYSLVYLFARTMVIKIGKEQVVANSMKYKAASEALSGIKDLKVLGRERAFLEKFAGHAQLHANNNITSGMISQLPKFALEIIAFGGILLIMLYFLRESGGMGKVLPIIALYAFAGYRLLPALQQIFSNITVVRLNAAGLEVLHQDLMKERKDKDPETLLPSYERVEPLPFTNKLVLKDVSYCYDGGQDLVLEDFNLTIAPNTSIGLVGATGSGKTTTVDIILGLLFPTSGTLSVDDLEISGENLVRWQRNLGYVPQAIYLCDDTIINNIAFGVPEQAIDMEAVVRAARIANLHEFIESELHEGYRTIIGERGVRLSGGQRQRIGIARALYRNPSVLIMDEATSALDGITEEAVMEALRTLSGQKTIIMIAHRLTTVKECDVIYLIEHGRIVSQGSYEELINTSSWFQAAARGGT